MQNVLETATVPTAGMRNWTTVPELQARPVNGRTTEPPWARMATSTSFTRQYGHAGLRRRGKLLKSWGNYPGAHGLTLVEEQGTEFLWLTDQDRSWWRRRRPMGGGAVDRRATLFGQ